MRGIGYFFKSMRADLHELRFGIHIVAIFIALLAAPSTRAFASCLSYEMQGVIRATKHFGTPSNSVAFFTVAASNCLWRIDIEQLTDTVVTSEKPKDFALKRKNGQIELPPGAKYKQVRELISSGTDGTNIFTCTTKSTDAFTNSTGSIRLGPEPMYATFYPFIQVLWAAFASSSFLDSQKTNVLFMDPPFASRVEREKRPIQFTFLNDQKLRLPKSMVITDPGYVLHMERKYPRPVPFDKGFQVASYSVKNVISTNALNFPAEFLLEVFRPKHKGSHTNDVELEEGYYCVVTNLTLAPRVSSFVPSLPGHRTNLIFDARDNPKRPIRYRSTTWEEP